MELKKCWIPVYILVNLNIILFPAYPSEAGDPLLSPSVKCRLTSGGEYSCRLRLANEMMRISLLSRISGDELEVLEPSFMSEPFMAGRLKLKGIIREFYSSRPASAGSSVFSEQSGFSLTDSFSGSSRFGLVLKTDRPGSDLLPGPAFWAFRTNGGSLSTGLILDGIELLRFGSFLMETDLLSSAGTAGADVPDRWFSERPVLPAQMLVNCASEVRMIMEFPEYPAEYPPENAVLPGRRALRPAGEELTAALSLLADFSFPAYSLQGHSLRGLLWLGSSLVSLRGYLSYNNADYICPAGVPLESAWRSGSKFFFRSRGSLNFNLSAEYNLCRNHPGILIDRMIEQEELLSVSAGFDSRFFRLRLDCDYDWSFDSNRSFSDSGTAAVFFRAYAEDFRLGIEAGLSGDRTLGNFDRQSLKMKAGLGWVNECLSVEADCFWTAGLLSKPYEAEDAGFTASVNIKTGAYRMSGKFRIDMDYLAVNASAGSCFESVIPEFTLGFESYALPVE